MEETTIITLLTIISISLLIVSVYEFKLIKDDNKECLKTINKANDKAMIECAKNGMTYNPLTAENKNTFIAACVIPSPYIIKNKVVSI